MLVYCKALLGKPSRFDREIEVMDLHSQGKNVTKEYNTVICVL